MKNLYAIAIAFVCLCGCGCTKDDGNDDKNQKPYLKLGINEKLVSNKAGSFDVYVTSNTDWTVSVQSDWIESISPMEGNGNKSVRVRYKHNYTDVENEVAGEPRTASVKFEATGTIPAKLTIKQGARTFKNPVFMPMPDPYVWREEQGGSVYYYPCKSVGNGVNLGKSNKLSVFGGTSRVWSVPKDGADKPWNIKDLWAPELHRVDGVWYIYYAAGRGENGYGTQRTGVLRNTNEDPTTKNWEDMGMIFTGNAEDLEDYKKTGKVTVDNTIYAIDMTVFKIGEQLYAVWSGNVSKSDGNQRLYIAPMENPWTIKHERVEISRPDYQWEKKSRSINEGPAMLYNPDSTKVFCVYSANASWMKDYALGWLELDLTNPATSDPLVKSNWKKTTNYAFYRLDNVFKKDNPNVDDAQNEATMHIGGVHGLGHNTFTKSPDGTEDWIVYHVKRYRDDGWDNRDCFIQKFTWKEDGTPDFGKPVGWQEEQEVPSGEIQ